jgi:uncharacterized protein YdeI (BOF family)
MKKLLFVGIATLSLAGFATLKADQNPNNTKDHVTTVAWIQAKDKADDIGTDDRYVVLVGKVTKQVKDETYIFTDGTGTIQLDSETKLPVGKKIAIRGNIDQAFLGIGKLEVDVTSFRRVK